MARDRKISERRAQKARSPQPPRPVSGQRTVLSEDDLSPAIEPKRTRIPRAQLSRGAFKRRLVDRTLALVTDWRFFTLTGLGVTGSIAFFSVAFLLKLPAMPNCPSVFWPLASASLRIHCAEIAASKQNVNDLLEAIKLLNTLPPEHPLYSEASRLIELWATDIMELADKDYQAGKLKEAISAVRQIPEKSSAHKLVADRIKTWEKTWGDAEKIYNKAIDILKKGTWREAQVEAVRLLSIDNTFWQTTKYQDISTLIVATREDVTKLGKAERALEGGADEVVKAIEEISQISDKSYVHKEAKELLPKLGRRMLALAQDALDRKDYSAALDIASRVPGNVKLDKEVDDFRILAQAQSKAWDGGVSNFEEAIAQAQRIRSDRPLHDKAQRLINRWQSEAKTVAQLEQAKQLARSGDLQNAISQANQISNDNPAAKEFIKETTQQMQSAEDQPILDQASQLANNGDPAGLQQAIAAAQQISSGRALYAQAQEKIRQWADRLSSFSKAPAPIAPSVEMPIVPTLDPVREKAEQSLQQARTAAAAGTTDGLVQAISIAAGVPDGSPLKVEATSAIEGWSNQMLQAAQSQAASSDLQGAIAIARQVPPNSGAYAQAQQQIQQWLRSLGQ
jgi:hypothetical protein